jgi:heme/copper-type cytochrome/quinol oxidase subunit 2
MTFIKLITLLTLFFYMVVDYNLRSNSGEFNRSVREEVETFIALFIVGFLLFFVLISPIYSVYLLMK